MKIFLAVINVLVFSAVLITAVRMYLTVNKMWKRKHEKSVSESISIFAYFLAIMVHLPFMFKWIFITPSIMPALNDALNIVAYLVIIVIGTGFWVKGNKKVNIWHLLLRAIRLESKESGHLLKALVQPSGARLIIEILEKVASLDDNVSDEEVVLIKKFAHQWQLDFGEDYDWKRTRETSLIDIRKSLDEYLELSPPPDQAKELVDLIELVIKADQIVTEEEGLFLDEVSDMISDYIAGTQESTMYYVLIVPQNDEQWSAIKILFPTGEPTIWRGGKVLITGKFYSKNFAEAICQKYISLGLFTISDEYHYNVSVSDQKEAG